MKDITLLTILRILITLGLLITAAVAAFMGVIGAAAFFGAQPSLADRIASLISYGISIYSLIMIYTLFNSQKSASAYATISYGYIGTLFLGGFIAQYLIDLPFTNIPDLTSFISPVYAFAFFLSALIVVRVQLSIKLRLK